MTSDGNGGGAHGVVSWSAVIVFTAMMMAVMMMMIVVEVLQSRGSRDLSVLMKTLILGLYGNMYTVVHKSIHSLTVQFFGTLYSKNSHSL